MSQQTDISGVPSAPAPAAKWQPFTLLGAKSPDPFPIIADIWNVYAGKGIRSVFLSIGSSASALADLELAESLGCPLHAVPLTDTERAAWVETVAILKDRKRIEPNTAYAFSEGAEKKWILPKNMRIQNTLPWWEKGSLDLSGGSLPTENALVFIERLCKEMKLKDNQLRLDILKLDTKVSAFGLECAILPAILHAGFRPGLLLVHWSKMPDTDMQSTLAAGHLQNCGYKLMAVFEDKFLYYFVDEDLYTTCSWERTDVVNPMSSEIVRAAKEAYLFRKPLTKAEGSSK